MTLVRYVLGAVCIHLLFLEWCFSKKESFVLNNFVMKSIFCILFAITLSQTLFAQNGYIIKADRASKKGKCYTIEVEYNSSIDVSSLLEETREVYKKRAVSTHVKAEANARVLKVSPQGSELQIEYTIISLIRNRITKQEGIEYLPREELLDTLMPSGSVFIIDFTKNKITTMGKPLDDSLNALLTKVFTENGNRHFGRDVLKKDTKRKLGETWILDADEMKKYMTKKLKSMSFEKIKAKATFDSILTIEEQPCYSLTCEISLDSMVTPFPLPEHLRGKVTIDSAILNGVITTVLPINETEPERVYNMDIKMYTQMKGTFNTDLPPMIVNTIFYSKQRCVFKRKT